MRHIVLPQALRLMIGPTIGYMVQIVKSTSVASLIGIVELTRTAVVVNTVTFEPLKVFGVVALTYFVLCWPLSLFAGYANRRIDARRAGGGIGDLLRRPVARTSRPVVRTTVSGIRVQGPAARVP